MELKFYYRVYKSLPLDNVLILLAQGVTRIFPRTLPNNAACFLTTVFRGKQFDARYVQVGIFHDLLQ
jgi:hypothetical protein